VDGGWSFMDGEDVVMENGMVVGLSEVVGLHPYLAEFADLPEGWCAWRDGPDEPWQRAPYVEDEPD
jgi:hypothetical protein